MASKKEKDPYVVAIGRRLSAIREAAGVEKADLARASEVDASVISRFESGERLPGVDILVAICRNLKTTVEFLVDGVAPDGTSWEELQQNLLTFRRNLEASEFDKYVYDAKVPPSVSDALLVSHRLRLEHELGLKPFTPSGTRDWGALLKDIRTHGVRHGLQPAPLTPSGRARRAREAVNNIDNGAGGKLSGDE